MAELILCELGEQGVLILLTHGQAGAVQHLEAVTVQPEHLVHVQDDAPVANDGILPTPATALRQEKVETTRHSPSSLTMPDVVILNMAYCYLPQGKCTCCHAMPDSLRFSPEENPPQLVGQLEGLFFPVGLEQVVRDGRERVHTYSGTSHEHQQ